MKKNNKMFIVAPNFTLTQWMSLKKVYYKENYHSFITLSTLR